MDQTLSYAFFTITVFFFNQVPLFLLSKVNRIDDDITMTPVKENIKVTHSISQRTMNEEEDDLVTKLLRP